MNQANIRKTIIIATLAAGLFLGTAGNATAFMRIDSDSHGGNEAKNSMPMMAHTENDKTVVARVNGAEITMGALMRTVKDTLMANYKGMKLTRELAKRIRYEALEQLAMEELAYQRAMSLGITVNQTDIETRLEGIKKAEGGEEALQTSLALRKKTIDDIKNDIRRFFAVKQAIEQEVDSKLIITEKEIGAAYLANKEAFVTPERVVITDIIFFLDPEDSASIEKVRSIKEKIITELNNDPTKLTPKGFVVKSGVDVSPDVHPELYEAAKEMEIGNLSGPLVVDGTLHLVKFDAFQARKEAPENTAKASVASQLKSFKKRQLLAEWRQGLLQDADIEIVHEMLK